MTRKRRRRRHPAARARYLTGGISVVATWGIVSSLVAAEPGPVAAGPATTLATAAPPEAPVPVTPAPTEASEVEAPDTSIVATTSPPPPITSSGGS